MVAIAGLHILLLLSASGAYLQDTVDLPDLRLTDRAADHLDLATDARGDRLM
jgi:hypothetical protein